MAVKTNKQTNKQTKTKAILKEKKKDLVRNMDLVSVV